MQVFVFPLGLKVLLLVVFLFLSGNFPLCTSLLMLFLTSHLCLIQVPQGSSETFQPISPLVPGTWGVCSSPGWVKRVLHFFICPTSPGSDFVWGNKSLSSISKKTCFHKFFKRFRYVQASRLNKTLIYNRILLLFTIMEYLFIPHLNILTLKELLTELLWFGSRLRLIQVQLSQQPPTLLLPRPTPPPGGPR